MFFGLTSPQIPGHCWVSGLFCNVSLNGVDDDMRHRNASVYTDIFEECFCCRRDSELRGGGHRHTFFVVCISIFTNGDLQVYQSNLKLYNRCNSHS